MLGIQLWQLRGLLWDLLLRSRHIFLVTCWSWDRSVICRGNRRMMLDKIPQHGKQDSQASFLSLRLSHESPASVLGAWDPVFLLQCPGHRAVPVSARNCSCPSGLEGGALCSCSCCFLCSICRTACRRQMHSQEVMAPGRCYL
jgi:hypothetical protein